MEQSRNTGWRGLAPAAVVLGPMVESADKKELFAIARQAVEALGLAPAARFVLEQMVGFYGGEPVAGRVIVWPSNDALIARTGLAERTVRYALRALLVAGVVTSKDSANGKRYARRDGSGVITDAFGFDLGPLLHRKDEFEQRIQALRDQQRARREQFDAITIDRRAAREAIVALEDDALMRRYEELHALTPRRSSLQPLDPIRTAWSTLRAEAEAKYNAACGGNFSRHKDQNKNTLDQTWNKRREETAGVKSGPELSDLAEACPDAWGFSSGIGNTRELVGAAGRLRGFIGIHQSAWNEACEALGPIPAATLVFLVTQIEADEQKKGGLLKSPGGYFRFYLRKVQKGEITISDEILRLKKRRRH